MDELMDKKRILITGSNGFLGQKLTDICVSKNAYVICCTSQSENRNPNQDGYQFQKLDLLDFNGLQQLIEAFKPSHIIHTAAMTSVEACEAQPQLCEQLNITVVDFLGKCCAEQNIHLTFLSTDFVFDGTDGPYDELALPNPKNAYGASKLAAEEKLLESNAAFAIIRTILVYGVIADKNRSNLVLWAKNKLSQGESIRVVDDQWRMPTWVDDLATACLLAVEKHATGIFHISGEEMYSIIEAVYEVADFWQLDPQLISSVHASELGQAENRPQKTGFILDKSKRILGYNPTPFRTSLVTIQQQIENFNV